MGPTKWNGSEMSQNQLMEKDTVLVLSENDIVIGSASKKESHVFSKDQPYGILHRAFSVFLFDQSTNEMLLQQRASTKITFPNVWTNTCCSHPLHGMEPKELDTPEDVAAGTVPGIKHAAIRKLEHELGIPPQELDVQKFKFLTRLHYWAADTVTHGEKSPWGEHEIDYVLFYTVPSKSVLTIKPHPDEVDDYCWVTPAKLDEMMSDPKLLFSPWCRLILQKWMLNEGGWWANLQETMTTDKHCDYARIHRFDPPREHYGGAGDAKPQFLQGDETKKQGAYGKIKTHKESKLKQLAKLDEVWSAITLLYVKPLKSNLETPHVQTTFDAESLAFCDDILGKVSRSFAAVIRQLPEHLLVDVLVFYLVLRALDTIEDDTTAFPSAAVKIQELEKFYTQALVDPTWSKDGVGEGDERRLLQEFPKCHAVFANLQPAAREVIADIATRMGEGMAEFITKDMGQGTKDISEYNRYCHFVAGLVGEGLSRLFVACGLEKTTVAQNLKLADQMGLFLQKVNIIRDYLEDYVDGRAWWPQSVWKPYSPTGDLGYFASGDKDPEARAAGLACLNELVTDALELAPDCLAYMDQLDCLEIFRFCAIPQVMAIATLDKLYANPDVFTGVVKIRKGLSCKLILQTNSLAELHTIFHDFAMSIKTKAENEKKKAGSGKVDPSYGRTVAICEKVIELTKARRIRPSYNGVIMVVMGAALTVFHKVLDGGLPPTFSFALSVMTFMALTSPNAPKSNLKVASEIESTKKKKKV